MKHLSSERSPAEALAKEDGAINPATSHVYKYKKCGMMNTPHHKK